MLMRQGSLKCLLNMKGYVGLMDPKTQAGAEDGFCSETCMHVLM